MQPVKIHIYSQSHSSAGTENIETTAYGRLAEKNNKYYVFYDESEAAGLAGVNILRSGTVDCRQECAGGLVSESMYRTPYLALPMRLTTEYLYVYCRDKVWHIDLEYVLELEGQTRSRFKLKMEIEEDVKREYEGSTGCCH